MTKRWYIETDGQLYNDTVTLCESKEDVMRVLNGLIDSEDAELKPVFKITIEVKHND